MEITHAAQCKHLKALESRRINSRYQEGIRKTNLDTVDFEGMSPSTQMASKAERKEQKVLSRAAVLSLPNAVSPAATPHPKGSRPTG